MNDLENKILKVYINDKWSIHKISQDFKINKIDVKRILYKFNIIKKSNSLGLEEFIRRAKEVHGDKYDYSKTEYKNNNHEKVTIICKLCGKEFQQIAASHLNGYGCECQRTYYSKGEFEIKTWLDNNKIRYEVQKKFEDCIDKRSLPFDFYLPDYRVAIEYQGQQHFSPNSLLNRYTSEKRALENFERVKKHDFIKKEYCSKNNIYLIAIIYDEIVNDIMNKEYLLFKNRYDYVNNFNFIIPDTSLLSHNFNRVSVETTGTRICEICGKEFEPRILSNGQRSNVKVCCRKCAEERTKRNNLEKWGYESPNQSPEVKAKQIKTNLERYGVKNSGSRPEAIEKARKTNLERYGVENGSQTEEARRKISLAVTKNIWTIEMDKELERLYIEENLPLSDIVKVFDIPKSSVIKEIAKLDLHRSGSKLIAKAKTKYRITKEELKALRDKGLTYAQIRKETGLSKGSLERRMKEFGLIDLEKSANTNNIKYTTETWIKKAKLVHGDLYDYSLVDYKTSKINVKIVCNRCGRIFEQNPNHHLQGCGCKYCNNYFKRNSH